MTSSAFLIQQYGEVVDEFRQHDGMVTVVMQLSLQGFAEHYENMTENKLEGEGYRTQLGNRGVCCPLPPLIYIGGGGRGGSP